MRKRMTLDALGRLTAHPEYGAVRVGTLTRDDLAGDLDALVSDIRKRGIVEPLKVRYADNGERWLDDGTHRAVVAMELGLPTVPVEIEQLQ